MMGCEEEKKWYGVVERFYLFLSLFSSVIDGYNFRLIVLKFILATDIIKQKGKRQPRAFD